MITPPLAGVADGRTLKIVFGRRVGEGATDD